MESAEEHPTISPNAPDSILSLTYIQEVGLKTGLFCVEALYQTSAFGTIQERCLKTAFLQATECPIMVHTSHNTNTSETTPKRRRPARVLTVRMLVAKVVWLEGRLRWQDGRVSWETPQGAFFPTGADIARAQRTLNTIRRYPVASEAAFGDSAVWHEHQRALLEQAKQLHTLRAPDLPLLAKQAVTRHSQTLRALTDLLPAEALCVNALPVSPCAALHACGVAAEPSLRALLADETALLPGRALAALTLGAIHHVTGNTSRSASDTYASARVPSRASAAGSSEVWLRRAYRWGVQNGLPSEPALLITLLAGSDGMDSSHRCLVALRSDSPLRLPPDALRELLAAGVVPARVVELAEVVACASGHIVERIAQRRNELPEKPRDERLSESRRLQQEREKSLAAIAEVVTQYACASHDPETLCLLLSLLQKLLMFGPPTPELVEAALIPLRSTLELPAVRQRPFLELLLSRFDALWPAPPRPDRQKRKRAKPLPRDAAWLRSRWRKEGIDLLDLMRTLGDASLVGEAFDVGAHRAGTTCSWQDKGFYRLLFALARTFNCTRETWRGDRLGYLLENYPSPCAARAALKPLTEILSPLPPALRQELFFAFVEDSCWDRQEARKALPRYGSYAALLLRFDVPNWPEGWCNRLVKTALLLDRHTTEQVPEWLEGVLTFLREQLRMPGCPLRPGTLEMTTRLAIALADGDTLRFQSIFHAVMRCRFPQNTERLEAGMAALTQVPFVHDALAHLFPQQPERCMELIVRLGVVIRLGERACLTLTGTAEAEVKAEDSEWATLCALAPELGALVSHYRSAQRATGRSEQMPPGVQRALETPRRLTEEQTWLEQTLEAQPEHAGLHARLHKIRARLADTEALNRSVRAEVAKALTQAAAEAQIAAAENGLRACFRARLERFAGPLPADLSFDADLLNALLLSTSIDKNRRTLRRLLQAHVSGDTQWRERHPANRKFLENLGVRGINVAVWLDSNSRLVPCPRAAGKRVRLYLENDPLHILQMGNYFQTCLSFGDCNAFSTVANACELNKRVLYARDGSGRVVGRKLLGLDAEGRLLGYHTYCSLSDDAGNAALSALIRQYVGDFASRCGLELTDTGTIPCLFTQDWYDDGAIAWNEAPPIATPNVSASR